MREFAMGILLKLLFFTAVYHYLKIEGAIAVLLILLTISQIKIDSPIWNLILFFVTLIITIVYLVVFFEFNSSL
jgi:hypothetical protein